MSRLGNALGILSSLAVALAVNGCYEGLDGGVPELAGTTTSDPIPQGSGSKPNPSTSGSSSSSTSTSTTTNPVATSGDEPTTTDEPMDSSESGSESGEPDVPGPDIPTATGECPDFASGMQFIGALNTFIIAGTPGETKGPLLLYWHGTGGNPTSEVPYQLPEAQRDDIVAQGGLILAPTSNGMNRGGYSPNGVWYEGTDGDGGDLPWVDHVVACAVENHNIDPRRIYTTGCSAGGLMASGVALKRSSYIAAATPNSGGVVSGDTGLLQDPERVPAMFTMHGGAGDTVVVNFGQTSATLDDIIVDAGGFAVDCNHQSGHCGAPMALRVAAWDFLEAHPYGTAPSPYANEVPPDVPGYCGIW